VKPPIFILGAQRSGTTMFRLMLNSHKNLALPHEVGFITGLYRLLPGYGDLSKSENVARLLEDVCNHPLVKRSRLIADKTAILSAPIDSYRSFIDAVMKHYVSRAGKKRWGDRTHTLDIDVLRLVYPDCKFIHLVRDGRDVMVSQKRMSWLSNNLPRLAREWHFRVMMYHKLYALIPSDFLEIRYEDLVTRPEPTLSGVCEFLGEPYDPGMLGYAESTVTSIPEASRKWHEKSVQAPDPNKIGVWKKSLDKSDRIIFDEIAGPLLDDLGYEREMLVPSFHSKLRKLQYSILARW
jgi:hypothetical protein